MKGQKMTRPPFRCRKDLRYRPFGWKIGKLNRSKSNGVVWREVPAQHAKGVPRHQAFSGEKTATSSSSCEAPLVVCFASEAPKEAVATSTAMFKQPICGASEDAAATASTFWLDKRTADAHRDK